jgi:hypothetical protein
MLVTIATSVFNTQYAQTTDSFVEKFIPPHTEPLLFTPGDDGVQITIPFENNYRTGNAVINLIYKGSWPQSAQVALEKARDILAASVSSSQSIDIDCYFTPLTNGNLGECSPISFVNSSNIPAISGEPAVIPNAVYPVALANKLAHKDFSPSSSDMTLRMQSNLELTKPNYSLNWYYGTDAKPVNIAGNHQVDFVTTALHEMIHGVGFLSFVSNNPAPFHYLKSGSTVVYDNFVENNSGAKLTSLPDSGPGINSLVVSDNVYFNSPSVLALNSGLRARLYAPVTYSTSSISHLNTATYPNGSATTQLDINSLMNHTKGNGNAIHVIGPITLGLLKDIGWTVDPPIGVGINENSFSSAIGMGTLGNNAFVLNFSRDDIQKYNIQVMNVLDQYMPMCVFTRQDDEPQVFLYLNSLAGGIYFVRATSIDRKQLFITKLLVAH